jgi:Calx-beta domain-containing protein
VTTSGPKTVAPAEAPVTAANAPEPEIQQPPATPAPAPVEADRAQAAAPKTSPLTTSPLTDTPSRAPVVSQKPPAAPPEPQPSTEVAAAPKVSTPSPADEAATTAVIRQQALSRAGTVSLQQANIVVSERATHAVIRIQRRDDYRGGITVQWRTIPGSAQPGIDYSPIGAGSLVIPEDQDSRVIYIPLMKNDASQSNEWFDLELTSVTGGARLGPITRTRITILDDH